MESVMNYFESLNVDIVAFLKATGLLVCATALLALVGRLFFGKKSTLNRALSSAISILFIYAITVALSGAGEMFQKFVTPLPFISIGSSTVYLFNFQADYTVVCTQVLSMIILSFLMNLVDAFLPTGKKVITWFLFRCIAVVSGLLLHVIASVVINTYLPEDLVTYAPVILLGVLALMLLTGALKFLVGLVLTTVNPLIAALYTFFFANIVGKQVTKAILTTAIIAGLILVLQKIGVVAISIASAALVIYIPLIILLLALWYIVGKLL